MATSAYKYTGSTHVPPLPTCRFPGCSRPCYTESYGRVHDFCGRTHASEFSRVYGGYGMAGSGSSKKRQTPSYAASTSSASSSSSSSRQPMKAIHHYSSSSLPLGRGSTPNRQIKFYNRDEPYYEFTNFYPCTVFIDGKPWPTTEHYFQAQKFVGTPYVEKIRRLHTPREAFQLSRDPAVSRWRRSDWETVKDNIMLKALRIKFGETPRLRDRLLSTGDKELVEHTSNDSYWGDGGGNGLGQNKLGTLLMQVRRELKVEYGPYNGPHSSQLRTQDDSHVPVSSVPGPAPRLRRSSSFSNISTCHTNSYTPVSSVAHSSGGGGRSGGRSGGNSGGRRGTKVTSTKTKLFNDFDKKFNEIKQGVGKAANAATKAAKSTANGFTATQHNPRQRHRHRHSTMV